MDGLGRLALRAVVALGAVLSPAESEATEVVGTVGRDLRLVSVDTLAFMRDDSVLLVRMNGVSGIQEGQPCRSDAERERRMREKGQAVIDLSQRCGARALRWLAVQLDGSRVSCRLQGGRRLALVRARIDQETREHVGELPDYSPGSWIGSVALSGWCWSPDRGDLGKAVVAAGWALSRHSRYGGPEGWARTQLLGGWGQGGFLDPETWLQRVANESAEWWAKRR